MKGPVIFFIKYKILEILKVYVCEQDEPKPLCKSAQKFSELTELRKEEKNTTEKFAQAI